MLKWLSAGNLTSDGYADQVVALVSANLELLPELVEGLHAPDPVVRGHTADALEKLARSYPKVMLPFLPELIRAAREDPVAMVQWHLAMVFGHLSMYPEHVPDLAENLFYLLHSGAVFTQCWTVTSLCILARQYPEYVEQVLLPLPRRYLNSRALHQADALHLLVNYVAFPHGWPCRTCSNVLLFGRSARE
jgi:hypothetical protein